MKSLNLLYRAPYVLWALLIAMVTVIVNPGFVVAQTITTFAGGETSAALATNLDPYGVVVDSAGNIFVSDFSNHRVRKISPSGLMTTVAGTGVAGFSNGSATSAQLNFPAGLALDASGNLYIADSVNNRIRKLTPAGVLSTVAGNGTAAFAGDGGPATSASLNSPFGVAVSTSGEIYIADLNNHRIRRVFSDGNISTYAGNGTAGFAGDGGAAISAQFNNPTGVALKADDTLFVADFANNRVRRISSSGIVSTYAGNGTAGFGGDGGVATSASLRSPQGVLLDAAGNLYIADRDNQRVRRVAPNGSVSGAIVTIAGSGTAGYSGDGGLAGSANLDSPASVALDAAGNLFIGGFGGRIRFVTPAGIIGTAAGAGNKEFGVGDGGTAAGAKLAGPRSVAFDAAGNAYVADYGNHRLRKITAAGVISTVAGTGTAGSAGDGGAATSAQLNGPYGVAVDAGGNVYVSEYGGHRVRKITPAGIISTYAGTGIGGFTADGGAATGAGINSPSGLAIDGIGNLYIADFNNQRVRRVTPAGTISTVAGTGTFGFSGDGGLATIANISRVTSVGLDGLGSLWIADYDNNRLRKVVLATGIITTVAGTGTAGDAGDGGLAASAQLNGPSAVKFDTSGNAYVADGFNNRVRKINSAGVISNVAGTGTNGFAGDGGPAASAQMRFVFDVAFDPAGVLYIADGFNNRVRKVTGLAAASRAANDLNGDGKSDLLLRDANGVINAYLMNATSVSGATTLLASGPNWTITHTGDLNGDGLTDLLFRNTVDGTVFVFLMNGLTVTSSVTLLGPNSPWVLSQVADFNGDGKSDLIWRNSVDGSQVLWLMNGTTIIGGGLILGAGPWVAIHTADFNGDGKADILWRNSNDGSVAMWLMDGATLTGAALILGPGVATITHTGDFNGDGKADLLVRNIDGTVAQWLMNGTSITTNTIILGAGPWLVSKVGDLNGDGKADIVWRNSSDGTIAAWLMNGATLTGAATLLGPGSGYTVQKLLDFNGDGKADIIWRGSDGSLVIWLMNGVTLLGAVTLTGPGTFLVMPGS
jgi:trimeric autotransporter adhesin